ncbi:MAG TPA: DUF4136 domain-containing protein [Deltaproteobacteria bacterium]|nr:DUF4136 domain-containing protein [Deltaproteobacteria bacterium]
MGVAGAAVEMGIEEIGEGMSMGRVVRVGIVAGLLLGLAGCQGFNVRTDWDPTVPFSSFRTYFWVEPPRAEQADPFADNGLLRKRVRYAIENELARRGFEAVDEKEKADFLVTYSVILEERLKVDSYTSSLGRGGYRDYYGFGSAFTTSNVRAYQESTLIIDFLDPETGDLVWRGWGTRILGTRDRDRGQERLEKGVRAILEKFPPESPD